MKINKAYFKNSDVLFLARDLIGKYFFTLIDGQITGGIITETEAYKGVTDKASHAYGGRRTKRTETMYAEGGVLYVYLCYGMHCLTNFVTNEAETPDAILIRAVYPTHGEELILKRTNKSSITHNILQGPGKVSKGLGITLAENGKSLATERIWLEDRELAIAAEHIIASPRIGVDYAGEDALLPYRFFINHKLLEQQYL
ncbi:MAG TPA: DNA-3-methyladenine glycosylase [Bacteroidales bacterium]|nr:DNA-3-methyladenine glycosylase [Bacteroidales bacterium]